MAAQEPATAVAREFHLVVQFYNDPHPERAEEIGRCLLLNAQNAHITRVHLLLESGTQCPLLALQTNPHVTVVPDQPRLTFASAFKYACDALPADAACCVCNADIYLDHGIDWAVEATDGSTQWLTRLEVHPGPIPEHGEAVGMATRMFVYGNSADTWIVPVALLRRARAAGAFARCADIRVGNQPGCDIRIAEWLWRVGARPRNEAGRLRTYHVDACAHRGRAACCVFGGDGAPELQQHSAEICDVEWAQRAVAETLPHARIRVETGPLKRAMPLCGNDRVTLSRDAAVQFFDANEAHPDPMFSNGGNIAGHSDVGGADGAGGQICTAAPVNLL
jgi:hypothetical protein